MTVSARTQNRKRKQKMKDLLEYLKHTITNDTAVEDVVAVFEKMCAVPMEEDMILFETGTFSFSGEPLFYFELVRQFPNEEEEYYQIHINVLFKPSPANERFSKAVWNEDIEENIFDYIRKSQAFAYARENTPVRIDVFMCET